MPGWIGPWEIAILLVIVLLVFGPKRLPEMGRSLGRGLREFKDSVTNKLDDDADAPTSRSEPAATTTLTAAQPELEATTVAKSEPVAKTPVERAE